MWRRCYRRARSCTSSRGTTTRTANKHNPNPDTWVGSGPTSIDEMGFAWVSLTYLEQSDFEKQVRDRQAAQDRTTQQQ